MAAMLQAQMRAGQGNGRQFFDHQFRLSILDNGRSYQPSARYAKLFL
jgi:hypothetical protein